MLSVHTFLASVVWKNTRLVWRGKQCACILSTADWWHRFGPQEYVLLSLNTHILQDKLRLFLVLLIILMIDQHVNHILFYQRYGEVLLLKLSNVTLALTGSVRQLTVANVQKSHPTKIAAMISSSSSPATPLTEIQDADCDPRKPCILAKALQANNPGSSSKQLAGCTIRMFILVIVRIRQS